MLASSLVLNRLFCFLLGSDGDVRLNLAFLFTLSHPVLQIRQFQFSYICYVPLFRSLTDGNCLHSAISVRLVGNNTLIHLLKILTSLQLFLNREFYSKHPVLTDVYNNGKTVLGEKLFCSYESVFELNRGLRDSQTSVRKRLRIYAKTTFYHLFRVFWLTLL